MNVDLRYLGRRTKAIIKDPDDHIQKKWMHGNYYEAQGGGMMNYVFKHEPFRGKYIDIGANIGNHTLFFKGVMEAKEVHSIEPYLKSYNHLVENVELNDFNDSVTCHYLALGDKQGDCSVKVYGHFDGMAQVTNGNDVLMFKVDDLDFFDGYDVVKIDVEGYNEELLKGAKETFIKGKGSIYIEAENDEQLETCDRYLNEYGYKRVEGLKLNHTATYLYKK